jgi:hypothetical protein
LPSFFAQREGGRAFIVGGDARHLARSLRARVGEEVEVVDPNGFLLTVRLDKISLDRVEGVVVAERKHNPEPVARITIAIAQLPAPGLELVLSRCFPYRAGGSQRRARRKGRALEHHLPRSRDAGRPAACAVCLGADTDR